MTGFAHAQEVSSAAQTAQTAPAPGTAAPAQAGQAQTAQGVPAQTPELGQSEPQTEQITVTGIRGSLQKSLEVKRNADGVVEAVSATDIGQLPDKNVADALQRLPGITTIQSAAPGSGGFGENDRIEIRGTAPTLTQTLIDGHAVATGDWFILDQLSAASRSVSYSLFPSEIVDHAVVYKSSQADLPEGGTAGNVNIVTRKPLDFQNPITAEASIGGAYSDLADKAGFQFNGLLGWKSDDSRIGVMIQGFSEDRFLRRDGQEELGYGNIPTGDTLANGSPNPFPAAIRGALYPQIINNALFEQERLRQGGDATIQFRPNSQWDIKLDGFYSYLNASNYNQGDLVNLNDFVNNGVAPTAYTVNNGVLTSATFPGSTARGNPGINDIYRPGASSSTYFVDFDTNYHPTSNWTVHVQLDWTRGKGATDQFAYGTTSGTGSGLSYGMNGTNPLSLAFPGAVGLNNPSNYSAFAGDGNQDWVGDTILAQLDTEAAGQLDVQYDFDSGLIQAVKGGVRVAQHVRKEVESENYGCYLPQCGPTLAGISDGLFPSDFGNGAGISTPFTLSVDPNGLQQLIKQLIGFTGQTSAGRFYAPAYFAIKETDTAGYVMALFNRGIFQGNAGIRVASTQDDITKYDSNPLGPNDQPVLGSDFGAYYVHGSQQNYIDILPSFSLKADVTPDVVARVSASRTVTRPDYYALAGGATLNDQLLSGSQGNPALKPTRSTNLDFSTEWYYAPQSSVSAGLFDLEMSSTFDAGTIQARALNLMLTQNPNNPLGLSNPIFSTYTITAPTNNSGHSRGLELAWQQPIAWGFGFATNYTYADSSQDNPTPGIGGRQLLGAAKHTGNITAYYDNDIGIDAHLSYTVHSQIYQGIDRAEKYFQDDGGELDGALTYNITKNFAASLDVLNITDEKDKYVTGTGLLRAIYDNGRTFYFQVTAKY
ncbi:MAG TPA: TonB-dependent receptor [Aliidongia sp.]|nr:TonB-dependent receptor [Aliidongia sp.]